MGNTVIRASLGNLLDGFCEERFQEAMEEFSSRCMELREKAKGKLQGTWSLKIKLEMDPETGSTTLEATDAISLPKTRGKRGAVQVADGGLFFTPDTQEALRFSVREVPNAR